MMVSVPISGTRSDTILSAVGLQRVKYDMGMDTDGDGTFDYLIVGVEINVSDAGFYEVRISGLLDSNMSYISVDGFSSSFLDAGLRVLNVSLNGPNIYVSGRNPRYVNRIEIWSEAYYGSWERVPLTKEYSYLEFDVPSAMLTGKIQDWGEDTDEDDTFNYLVIGVEINVTKPGTYSAYVSDLLDKDWNWIEVWGSESGYLDVGIRLLNVSLSGYMIRASQRNPRYVNHISLEADYHSYINNVNLSREYLYTEFDAPAVLTGVIFDQGLDTDDDDFYNFLEIGIQVNVSDPGNYWVSVSGLRDSDFDYISVYASKSVSLEAGLQVVNLTLDGTRIYLSQKNPKYVDYISLDFWEEYYWYDQRSQVPLSREYSYTEFDPPGATLTGKIYDQGIDEDADGFYDFLEIGVEVNVTDIGTYSFYVSGLTNATSDKEEWEHHRYYINVWDSKTVDLDVGIQIVTLYLYGPQIYVSRHNPVNVSHISVSDAKGYYHSLSDVPLSRVYSYTEFDAPFWDVETKFIVYPDGRVALQGSMEHTNMVPKNTGPTATGFFNLTGNEGTAQAQAGLKLTFPPELASQFPLNSTTANLLATYSNSILNLGINSTMTLPPGDPRRYPYYPFGQWPYNATDGTITLTYSEGTLNLDIEGSTTLPPIVKSQFPLNSTDITVRGNYVGNTLDGTITFSIIDEFTFDDINLDFTGNRTDLTLNGTVTVVFGVPLDNFIIKNSTELQELIDQLKSAIPGENGIIWNMTGGWLNVTTFNIDYTLLDNWGAKVNFEIKVKGDFVRALTHLISNGRNTELLYPVLDEAYSSAKSGSFFIDYKHESLKATAKVTFSYDFKRLVDNALTPPPGTLTYILASYSMTPTLTRGDVVFVEPIKNASDIVAHPTNGDIIAFYRPDSSPYYPEIIIHRAINRTFTNGTWYFETKGDRNWSPDPWRVPENLVIGKVVRRIPLLGFLLFPNLLGYYWYSWNIPVPLGMGVAAFSSIQEASIKLSYSSLNRQFDLKLTLVKKLKWLVDEITRILPESWPLQTSPEVKEFFEKLLNTTYASVSSAQISTSYANGIADFKATVDIEGDLNKEINYVKDLYFQLYKASFNRYNMTILWQLDFIDQTQLDLSKLKVSAQLGETWFKGRVQGVIITPPRDVINATHFKLERLFNLTAPQYPWQREFPGQNQRLKITVEGESNATHMVTLIKPETIPEPDLTLPYNKSMVWSNQTLSGLKDLIFKIGPRITGTLTVRTTPVSGEVFVNDESWGLAPQSRVIDAGDYTVSFGSVIGYYTPAPKQVTVEKDTETVVEGIYEPITGTLTILTTPIAAEVFVNGTSWGVAPQSRVIQIGTYNVSFGQVEGLRTPPSQIVNVEENAETVVEGVYEPIPGIVVRQITNPELINATNPFIINATEDATTYLIIYEISDSVTIIIKNVTDPDADPPQGTWKVLGNYVQIDVNPLSITANVTIRIYYTQERLEALGLEESTLTIHYWNTTLGEWVAVESHINTEEHYVWVNIDHFSLWALMGQPPSPLWAQPQFLAIVGMVIAVIAIVTIVILIRKRKPIHPAPGSAQTLPS
jgi:signal peptidase I